MKQIQTALVTLIFLIINVTHTGELKPSILTKKTRQSPINPDVFTEQSKQYMQYCISLWNQSAETAKINQETGLAAVWSKLQQESIEAIIKDQDGLVRANSLLADLVTSPVYNALPSLVAIKQLHYLKSSSHLSEQLIHIVINAKLLSETKNRYVDFNNDIVDFNNDIDEINASKYQNTLAFTNEKSIPHLIKLLKNNTNLNAQNFMPLSKGLLLLNGFLQQQNSGFMPLSFSEQKNFVYQIEDASQHKSFVFD